MFLRISLKEFAVFLTIACVMMALVSASQFQLLSIFGTTIGITGVRNALKPDTCNGCALEIIKLSPSFFLLGCCPIMLLFSRISGIQGVCESMIFAVAPIFGIVSDELGLIPRTECSMAHFLTAGTICTFYFPFLAWLAYRQPWIKWWIACALVLLGFLNPFLFSDSVSIIME